jgi:phosphatidylinositol alpha-mannosyltransferase
MLRWWKWVLAPRLPRLHLALAVSPAARAAFERYFGHDYEIVPNGIDLDRFAPNGHVPAGDGEQSLLFVGQLVPKKGLPVLLDAFDALLEEFPRLRLRVVGDGPMRDGCRRRLSARSRPQVAFLGELHGDALVREYRECDLFCAPSVGHESFGITLLEAMAAGKPIVAARIPGYVDVVRDGEEALLHRTADPSDLRDALRRVVTDGALRRRLVERGQHSVQAYGWKRVASTVAEHYERMLRERC